MNKYHGIGHSTSGFFVYHVLATRLEPKQRPDLWLEEDRQCFEKSVKTLTITIMIMVSKTKITGNSHNDGTIIIIIIIIKILMKGLDDFHVVAKGPKYWL